MMKYFPTPIKKGCISVTAIDFTTRRVHCEVHTTATKEQFLTKKYAQFLQKNCNAMLQYLYEEGFLGGQYGGNWSMTSTSISSTSLPPLV